MYTASKEDSHDVMFNFYQAIEPQQGARHLSILALQLKYHCRN